MKNWSRKVCASELELLNLQVSIPFHYRLLMLCLCLVISHFNFEFHERRASQNIIIIIKILLLWPCVERNERTTIDIFLLPGEKKHFPFYDSPIRSSAKSNQCKPQNWLMVAPATVAVTNSMITAFVNVKRHLFFVHLKNNIDAANSECDRHAFNYHHNGGRCLLFPIRAICISNFRLSIKNKKIFVRRNPGHMFESFGVCGVRCIVFGNFNKSWKCPKILRARQVEKRDESRG